jgi:hypothetical protein
MQLKNFHLFGPLPASISLGIFGTLACCWFITPQLFGIRVPNILPFIFKVAPTNNNENITLC